MLNRRIKTPALQMQIGLIEKQMLYEVHGIIVSEYQPHYSQRPNLDHQKRTRPEVSEILHLVRAVALGSFPIVIVTPQRRLAITAILFTGHYSS